METCSICALFAFAVCVLPPIIESIQASNAARAAAKALREAAEADAAFQREHPAAWQAKEMVKLEQDRLEAEKALAKEYADRQNSRENAGTVAAIVRIFFG